MLKNESLINPLEERISNYVLYSNIVFSDLPQSHSRDSLIYIALQAQSALFSVYKLYLRDAPSEMQLHLG